MDKRSKKIKDIRNLCHEINSDEVVFFEQFDVTLSRSNKNLLKNRATDDDDDEDEEINLSTKTSLYNTPFGIIPIPEFNDGTKQFKFWTMHTKVKISSKIIKELEEIDGLETLEQYSPYRARIGVAPLFMDNVVLNSIKEVIKNVANNK